MNEPRVERPDMPGYGVPESPEGALPWAWAEQRLANSHNYWLATVSPDGQPHAMPIWALWFEDRLWFSTAARSRKGRNLARDTRCTVTTESGDEAVIVEGAVERFASAPPAVKAGYEAKYSWSLEGFTEPWFALRPARAFAIDESDMATMARYVF